MFRVYRAASTATSLVEGLPLNHHPESRFDAPDGFSESCFFLLLTAHAGVLTFIPSLITVGCSGCVSASQSEAAKQCQFECCCRRRKAQPRPRTTTGGNHIVAESGVCAAVECEGKSSLAPAHCRRQERLAEGQGSERRVQKERAQARVATEAHKNGDPDACSVESEAF